MTVSRPSSPRPWALLFVAVCLVAVNMRMTITGVGPLLDQIAASEGVSLAALGVLGSLPLLAWALCSPLAHGFSARFGMSTAVSWSLVLLALGTAWRSLPGSPANLWLGTALTGVGLAIGNVLMPAVIKRDFPERVPLVMGAYTALLGGLGALAAGIVVPISHIPVGDGDVGWRTALLATGALLPVALAVWMWATRPNGPRGEAPGTAGADGTGERVRDDAGRRIWGDPLAWLVALYMGSQSAVFYMLSTWFAPYQLSLGRGAVEAGIWLMVFQFIGIGGSLLVPLLARGRLRRWLPAALPAVGLIAWLGFFFAPDALPVWIVVGGLVGGASLTMALTLMAMRARSASHSTALSGMAQSLGYLVAAVGPTAFGWLHGLSGGWIAPFALIWAAAAAQLVIGVAVGRPRFVLDPR